MEVILVSIVSVIEPSSLLLWQIAAAMILAGGVSGLFATAIMLASTVEVVRGRPITIRRIPRRKQPTLCQRCQIQFSKAQPKTQ